MKDIDNCNILTTFSSQIFFSLEGDNKNLGDLLKKCSVVISNEQRAFYRLLWDRDLKKNKESLLLKAPFEKEENDPNQKKIFWIWIQEK